MDCAQSSNEVEHATVLVEEFGLFRRERRLQIPDVELG